MHVVLIDLDDTLVDDTAAAQEAIAGALKVVGLPASGDAVEVAMRKIRRAWAGHHHRHTGALTHVSAWEALWLPRENTGLPTTVVESLVSHECEVWEAVLISLGGEANRASTAAATYRQLRHRYLRTLPGAQEALAIMRSRHSLWLVTNGLSIHQRAKLAATGLRHYFERLFISGELGAAKSEPAFAAAVHAALKRDGSQVCMVVGDSSAQDLVLAAQGGWPAVHLCRAGACGVQAPSQPAATHVPSLTHAAASCRCVSQLGRFDFGGD